MPQNSRQQTPESPVSRPGAVRDAGVHHGNPSAAGMGEAQEVRPELSFCDHNQRGLQQSQIWPDRKGEVEREVKNILLAEAGSSQLLTCIRRSRNDDSMLRKSFCEFRRQTADRQNLADRYRVNPYCWPARAEPPTAAEFCPAVHSSPRGTCRGASFAAANKGGSAALPLPAAHCRSNTCRKGHSTCIGRRPRHHRLACVHPIIENHVLYGHTLSAAAKLRRSFCSLSGCGRLPGGKAFCHASGAAGEDLSRTR